MTATLKLHEGEKVIKEVRRHWFILLSKGLTLLALAVLPPIIIAIVKLITPVNILFPVSETAAETFIYALWLLTLWIVFFVQWSNYYLDVWIITGERIISIDQIGIFHRTVSNVHYNRIQDIRVEVSGLLATMFHFGDLRIQTAAEDADTFFMKHIGNPDEVRRVIFDLHSRAHGALASTDGQGAP